MTTNRNRSDRPDDLDPEEWGEALDTILERHGLSDKSKQNQMASAGLVMRREGSTLDVVHEIAVLVDMLDDYEDGFEEYQEIVCTLRDRTLKTAFDKMAQSIERIEEVVTNSPGVADLARAIREVDVTQQDFVAFRAEVDSDDLLNTFDLALGYFAGRGVPVSDGTAQEMAAVARDRVDTVEGPES
jgi:hypothetical protein